MERRPESPNWSDSSAHNVRVLLECDPESSPSIIAPIIERHGFEVRTCEGPHSVPCELLTRGACTLVDGADVVVNMMRDDETAEELVEAITSIRRPPAVVAQMHGAHAGADSDDVVDETRRVIPIGSRVSSAELIESIKTAIMRNRRPIPIWGDGFC